MEFQVEAGSKDFAGAIPPPLTLPSTNDPMTNEPAINLSLNLNLNNSPSLVTAVLDHDDDEKIKGFAVDDSDLDDIAPQTVEPGSSSSSSPPSPEAKPREVDAGDSLVNDVDTTDKTTEEITESPSAMEVDDVEQEQEQATVPANGNSALPAPLPGPLAPPPPPPAAAAPVTAPAPAAAPRGRGKKITWTAEEDAAVVAGVDKFGFDFERIRNDNLLEDNTDRGISDRFNKLKGDAAWKEKLEDANLTMTATPRKGSSPWTAKQENAVVEGVEKFGFDFAKIKAENKELLTNIYNRSVKSIEKRYEMLEPQKYREWKPKNPNPVNPKALWTDEQDVALKRGMLKHHLDWEKILKAEKKVLGHRKAASLEKRYKKLLSHYRNYKYLDDEGNEMAGDEDILKIAASLEEEEDTTKKKRGCSPPAEFESDDESEREEPKTSSKRPPQKKRGRSKKSSPPPMQQGLGRDMALRRGKWTLEEQYAEKIIVCFDKGNLDAPAGVTVRSYLCENLNCDSMRISKKITGTTATGNRRYTLTNRNNLSEAKVKMDKVELATLETMWRIKMSAKSESGDKSEKEEPKTSSKRPPQKKRGRAKKSSLPPESEYQDESESEEPTPNKFLRFSNKETAALLKDLKEHGKYYQKIYDGNKDLFKHRKVKSLVEKHRELTKRSNKLGDEASKTSKSSSKQSAQKKRSRKRKDTSPPLSDDDSDSESVKPIVEKKPGEKTPGEKGSRWTAEDVAALEEGIKKHGRDWDDIWNERQHLYSDQEVRFLSDMAYLLRKAAEKAPEKAANSSSKKVKKAKKTPSRSSGRIRGGGGDSDVDSGDSKRMKVETPITGPALAGPAPVAAPASSPAADPFKEHRFFPLATDLEHSDLKREFNERFWELRAETDRFYFYHFDSESEFSSLAEARSFAETIVEYVAGDSRLCVDCAKINPATTRLDGHKGNHLKRKNNQDPFEKRRSYPLANRAKFPDLNHEFPVEHWEVRKLDKSGHSYFRHLLSSREFASTNDARRLAKTMAYYTPPPVVTTDPFFKRRELPLLDRQKNTKVSGEFPEQDWEVRSTLRSSQFYLKHLESGKEFNNIGEARVLARTLPNYVAPVVVIADPFAKRRHYPLLDRTRNVFLSAEFPAEFWEVRKQPLSGHCYLKHLESGSEFIRPDEARRLAITMDYYSPPPTIISNPAAKFRNLPLLARNLQVAIANEFPDMFWEVRRSQNCQYYFRHLKTEREFSRISDARLYNKAQHGGGVGAGGGEKGFGEESPMDVSVSSSSMEPGGERRAYANSFDTTITEPPRTHTISMDTMVDIAVPIDIQGELTQTPQSTPQDTLAMVTTKIKGMDGGRIRGGGGRRVAAGKAGKVGKR
ncbi:hypothetical protein TrLO_g14433, partial [Triparma laevis f. longispina]